MPETGEKTVASPAGAAGSEATVLTTVKSLGGVIGPSALITGLLFYFGWAKTQAFSQYFGLDVSLFKLSTQDYLLQSIGSVYIPLGEVLIAGLFLLWAHRMISRHLELHPERPFWRRLARLLAGAGVALFVAGLIQNANRRPTAADLILTPVSLMLGVGLFSYGVLIDRRRRQPPPWTQPGAAGAPGLPALSVLLVSMLIAVGLVWVVANYAEIKGKQEAEFVLNQLEFQPGVVVYSPKRLHIEAPGIKETRFSEPDSAYGFRYDGLKLLFHANSRYFLVPDSWTQSSGTTIILRDDDNSMRVDFIHPTG